MPTAAPQDSHYSLEQVGALLGLSPAQLRGYVRAGLLEPEHDPDGALRFSFRDLVFLRVVKDLARARIPARRMRHALRRLRERLPADRPLSGLRLGAQAGQLVVRENDRLWSPESGQFLFDFEREAPGVEPIALAARRRAEATAMAATTAEGWYVLGSEVEDADPDEARRAYRRALEIDPSHAGAHVNLGCLEHEAGHLTAAERHYRAALEARAGDDVAAFNLGVVLEDLGRLDEARAWYERALTADPSCADAHYNLARLHDRLGDPAAALRHLKHYRRLTEG